MEKRDFSKLENECQQKFLEAGKCFHVHSHENHPVLFHTQEEFKAAMNAIAFVALLFPDIIIYTFEIMENHFHFVISGGMSRITSFFKSLVSKLSTLPELEESRSGITSLSFQQVPIESLDNLRNTIAYSNSAP